MSISVSCDIKSVYTNLDCVCFTHFVKDDCYTVPPSLCTKTSDVTNQKLLHKMFVSTALLIEIQPHIYQYYLV